MEMFYCDFAILQNKSDTEYFGPQKFSDIEFFGRIKCLEMLTSEIFRFHVLPTTSWISYFRLTEVKKKARETKDIRYRKEIQDLEAKMKDLK